MPELTCNDFPAAAREMLAQRPATLALIELPEARLDETCIALRSRLRRYDAVGACGTRHAYALLVDAPPAVARERVAGTVTDLSPGDPPLFHVGIVSSHPARFRGLDALVEDAAGAAAAARDRGVLVEDDSVAGPSGPPVLIARMRRPPLPRWYSWEPERDRETTAR